MARRIRTEDRSTYNNLAEDENKILMQAEAIHRKRLERHGAITDPTVCGEFLRARYAKHEHEVFGVVFLDTRHRIICVTDMFLGSTDSAEICPREVAKACLHLNATSVVICHNHPSGSLQSSLADRAVTTRIQAVLRLLDIRLLDHIIVSSEGTSSMAQQGLL